MGADISRVRFDPALDLDGVVMQQGRLLLDSDWNEALAILDRRLRAETADLTSDAVDLPATGVALVPRLTPDGFRISAAGGKLTIGRGRIYVDGLLAENHGAAPFEFDPLLAELRGSGDVPYEAQPYWRTPAPLPSGGPHLVYLDVWERQIGHVELDGLIDPAIGVDTTARQQLAWQVRILPNVGAGTTCSTAPAAIPGWLEATTPSAGRLTVDTIEVDADDDPCELPPSGGYRGLENQLYRIEIHDGGAPGTATFKWSRDNASVVTAVTEIIATSATGTELRVASLGRDQVLGFATGDWVEVTDDRRELDGRPGDIRQITVDDAQRSMAMEPALTADILPSGSDGPATHHLRVRRWNQGGPVNDADGNLLVDLTKATSSGLITVPAATVAVVLERGITAQFDVASAGGQFRTGDHWMFAARTTDTSVERLTAAPPRGTHHHYARLALVTFPATVTDCRTVWPAETLSYVAGDGQEVTPTPGSSAVVPLPVDPTVGVARGPVPVDGSTVRFTVIEGGGTIDGSAGPVDVLTADGLASVVWALDSTTPVQRLSAELLDVNAEPTSLPVRFSARLRTADVVSYDPADCADLAGVTNVQDAIDKLCERRDHGGCCATVGRGAEFETIGAAVAELSKRHDGHVCICLAPERHRFERLTTDGLQTLTISGRGAVLELTEPLELLGIADLAIQDLDIIGAAEGLDVLLDVRKCGRVELKAVHAQVSLGKDDTSVVRFGQCGQVRVADSELANAIAPRGDDQLVIRDRLPDLARSLLDIALHAGRGEDAQAAVTEVLARPTAERRTAARRLSQLIAESRDDLGVRRVATLERIGTFLVEGQLPSPAKLRDLLDRIERLERRDGAGIAGTAIELLDGEGDVWLEGNRIIGGVKLYGGRRDPRVESRVEANVRRVAAAAPAGSIAIPKGSGRFLASHNLIDWIALGGDVMARLAEIGGIDASKAFDNLVAFQELTIQGNTFNGGPQALMAAEINLGSNRFGGDDGDDLGFAAANAAVVSGNIGPGPQAGLVVCAEYPGIVANARINVVPPPIQPDWRWCSACQGLYFGPGQSESRCPAADRHVPSATSHSGNYALLTRRDQA